MIEGGSGCSLADAYKTGGRKSRTKAAPEDVESEAESDAESEASDVSKSDYTKKELENEKKAKPIVVDGKKYKMRYGSRRQVYNGTAYTTKGNLKQKDIIKNKQDRFVSRKKSRMAKKEQRLLKYGYGATKGTFGFTRTKEHTQEEINALVKKTYGDDLLAGRIQKRKRKGKRNKRKTMDAKASSSSSSSSTKRRGTKRRGTKRRGTKRRGTKRR